jgi:hypothetical protein
MYYNLLFFCNYKLLYIIMLELNRIDLNGKNVCSCSWQNFE